MDNFFIFCENTHNIRNFQQYLMKIRKQWGMVKKLLVNSANTKCRLFHVKINCSKFRIDRHQQLCHVIFLICLFVTSRNYYCLVYFCQGKFSQFCEKNPTFQANVTEGHTSLTKRSRMFRKNLLKVPVKKLNLEKSITANELLHKWFLRFPVGLFFTYLLINLFTEACLCLI